MWEKISYGLFPSRDIREKFPDETNWGEKEYGWSEEKVFSSDVISLGQRYFIDHKEFMSCMC